MRVQPKAPWHVIFAVAVVACFVVVVAQWLYPVKASLDPNLDDRWKAWAKRIRAAEKANPTVSTPSIPTATP